MLLDHLKQLESRGVYLKIAVNAPQTYRSDTEELIETGRFERFTVFRIFTWAKLLILYFLCSGAEVREVDLRNITGGVVHTKLWVVDKKHMYVGSANMDWRSLTQVFPEISSFGILIVSTWQIMKSDCSKTQKVPWNVFYKWLAHVWTAYSEYTLIYSTNSIKVMLLYKNTTGIHHDNWLPYWMTCRSQRFICSGIWILFNEILKELNLT